MIDQKQTIQLAIQSGLIDSADIDSVHISQAYIDDLSEFAHMVQKVERTKMIIALELYFDKLVEIGNECGPDVVRAAINMLEEMP